MSVTKFFEKMVGLQTQKYQQKVLSYRSIVANIGTGGEPNPLEVDRLLAETNKTIEDLQRDVDRYERRVSLKALVASLPKLGLEHSQLQHQVAEANRDLEDAERRHAEITFPLESRLREITASQMEANQAKQELFDTCGDPDLRRQFDEVIEQLNQNVARQRDLVSEISMFDNRADHAAHSAERELSRDEIERVREKAASYKKRADELRSEMKSIAQANRDLEKRREQIEQQMRDW